MTITVIQMYMKEYKGNVSEYFFANKIINTKFKVSTAKIFC